jgi:hypothetical protein
MPAVVEAFEGVLAAEVECNAANIEENDHTVFTSPDLQFELELLEQAIAKKMAFLENQVRATFLWAGRETMLTRRARRSSRAT